MTFADAIVEVLRDASGKPERATPASVCRVLAEETERHLDRVQYSAQRYMRHPIALWDDWEVMLIAWERGQVTPVHDHRGVMGGMVVMSGALQEERFETPQRRPELYENRTRPEATCRTSARRSCTASCRPRRAPCRCTCTGRRCARWASGTTPE